jgi:putative spermidine/putrescine transport system substrate-binding protein
MESAGVFSVRADSVGFFFVAGGLDLGLGLGFLRRELYAVVARDPNENELVDPPDIEDAGMMFALCKAASTTRTRRPANQFRSMLSIGGSLRRPETRKWIAERSVRDPLFVILAEIHGSCRKNFSKLLENKATKVANVKFPDMRLYVVRIQIASRRQSLRSAFAAVLGGGCSLLAGCGKNAVPAFSAADLQHLNWQQILASAAGKAVRLAMWDGDPAINRWMQGPVAGRIQELFNIELQFTGLRGRDLVWRLMSERDAGRQPGDLDIVWINGETFYQLRQVGTLFGPFTQKLPNQQLIDWGDPFIANDFQQPVDGYECPWGSVQFTLIHHAQRVPSPPQTLAEFERWIEQHPGRFTWDADFTGLTFLKSVLLSLPGSKESFSGAFDERVWQQQSQALWSWISRVKSALWREGQTFPADVAQLHQLFSSGEVDFTMSANDGEVDNKVVQGVLPEAARGYVPLFGTIRNSHYLGIPMNAPNIPGALAVINHLISPEAQLEKAKPENWGDGWVLSEERLSADWQQKFASIGGRSRVPSRVLLRERALPEPSAELMMHLAKGFQERFIEGG